ncbi:polysaccharide deacetylase family protein [Candidatus Berkelbacteria bacterium]|nr:polysaccharide deacetylase family protein [Candidatus Berkelbacteria bacterium]
MSLAYSFLLFRNPMRRALPAPLQETGTVFSDTLNKISTTVKGVRTIPVPILTYHYIREINAKQDPAGYRLSVSPVEFARQLDALQQAGFKTVTPREFLAGKIDDQSIILSFDDGYRDFYEQVFPALTRRGLKAVIFVISGLLDDQEGRYMRSEQVTEIARAGIEIGSHSVTHTNLETIEGADLQAELLESRFTLEKLVGDRVVSVAYPSGRYDDDTLRMAEFVGYRLGVTTESGVARLADSHLTLPRINVRGGESAEDVLRKIELLKAGATDSSSPSGE